MDLPTEKEEENMIIDQEHQLLELIIHTEVLDLIGLILQEMIILNHLNQPLKTVQNVRIKKSMLNLRKTQLPLLPA